MNGHLQRFAEEQEDMANEQEELRQRHAAALERITELEAENAKLRHHAEAMTYVMEERWNGHKNEEAMADALDALDKASDAYRAEFPEGSR